MTRTYIHHTSGRTTPDQTSHRSSRFPFQGRVNRLLPLLLAGLIALSGCGGGTSSQSQSIGSIAGNWQFTMAGPADNSFLGGMHGGFLLQKNGVVTGGVIYPIMLPPEPGGSQAVRNS